MPLAERSFASADVEEMGSSEHILADPFAIAALVTGRWFENCYLVQHRATGEVVIIDPGYSPESIVQEFQKLGGRAIGVILTHAHHDHVAGAAGVCQSLGAPCWIHVGDARLLRHAPMYSLRFGGPLFKIPESIQTFADRPGLVLGGQPVDTLLTPGHTAGSVCYRFGTAVVTGDTLLNRRVGRTDLPGGNAAVLHKSIDLLLAAISPGSLILPGHGAPWPAAEAVEWWQKQTTAIAASPSATGREST